MSLGSAGEERRRRRSGGGLRLVDNEAIEARIAYSCLPVVRLIIFNGEPGEYRAIERVLAGVDDDAHVALPDNQIARLRVLHSAETVDAGKDFPRCGVVVDESGFGVNRLDKVGAVRLGIKPAP